MSKMVAVSQWRYCSRTVREQSSGVVEGVGGWCCSNGEW